MDNDDLPVGRVLDRREAIRLLTIGGIALTGCGRAGLDAAGAGETAAASAATAPNGGAASTAALPGCVVRPQLTEGPYFVDGQLDRSDIRSDATGGPKPGAPLALTINVTQVANGACTPLAGALVDVWHCDAAGTYSGVNDEMVGFDTRAQKYLRGYQVTDAKGQARFTTIYPGWYQGRTVHIHFKVRTPASAALAVESRAATAGGGATARDSVSRTTTTPVYEFTSQLFFDETLSDRVYAQAPYAGKGQRDTTNASDGIFQESNGQLLLAVAPAGDGYAGTFDIGLDLSDAATGRADRDGGPGGPPPGGPPPGGRGGRPPGPPPGGRRPNGPPPPRPGA